MTISRFSGAVHLHTDLSHDGMLSFDELTRFIKSHGYDFMAITEHSYDVDQASMNELAENAKIATTDKFLVIPGIEFRCESEIDILGLGVYETIESDKLVDVIDHIHAHDGVAIFAHPSQRECYQIEPNWVSKLDGVEMFNHREGKFLPQIKTIRLCHKMQDWHPTLNIHISLDLHSLKGFKYLSNTVLAERLDRGSILEALRQGLFTNESLLFRVKSNGHISAFYYLLIVILRAFLNTIRWFRSII